MTIRAGPAIFVATIFLMLACMVSGRPQVFSDTKAYYALGEEVARVVAAPFARGAAPGPVATSSPSIETLRGRPMTVVDAAATTRLAYTVAGSRSPYWSVLLYLLVAIGTAWAVVAANAFAAAATIHAAMRAFDIERAFLPVVAVLACVSTLPLFVLFLMPDVFTGLAILAVTVLLSRWRALSWRARAGLWIVVLAAALFHTSHIPLVLVLGLAGVALGWWRGDKCLRIGAWAAIAAALIGAVGAVAYPAAVRAMRGERIYAPPFVAARLIADGPGRSLLAKDCARGDAWGWCRFTGQPMVDVNQILWATDPGRRVFQAADYDQRVRIIEEQGRFVLATIRHDPVGVVGAALGNVGGLLLQYGSFEVLEDATPRYRDPSFAVFSQIVPGTAGCRDGTASCASRIPIGPYDAVLGVAMLASLVVIGWLLVRRPALRARWLLPLGLLLAGYIINAAICGALSGVAERYQARIAWLVPLAALFLIADRRRRIDAKREGA